MTPCHTTVVYSKKIFGAKNRVKITKLKAKSAILLQIDSIITS